jgi:hypothetical protein
MFQSNWGSFGGRGASVDGTLTRSSTEFELRCAKPDVPRDADAPRYATQAPVDNATYFAEGKMSA